MTLLAARVHTPDGLGPPLDHLALRVDTAATESWLVDVGFGSFSHHSPRLDSQADQPDPTGSFRITPTANGDLEVTTDGEPQSRLEPHPRRLADFTPTCWWHQTSPASHFTRSLVCSLLTRTGRMTLSDRTLVETTPSGRHERVRTTTPRCSTPTARARFGIDLDRLPSRSESGGR